MLLDSHAGPTLAAPGQAYTPDPPAALTTAIALPPINPAKADVDTLAYRLKPTCMQKAPASACMPVSRCLSRQPKAQVKQTSCLSWARCE